MTIASTTNRNEYPGAGSAGPFTFNFRIFAASDLRVIRRSSAGVETVLAYPADYTVPAAAIGTATGTLTLTAVLAVGETLVIRRVLPLTQGTDLANQGPYFPKNIEDQFDRQVAIDQQLQAQVDRSVQLDESLNPASYDLRIPAGSAGQAIGWNSTGTGLANLSASVPSANAYLTGAGSPEGAIVAGVGTVYVQTDGANGKTLWRKIRGVGNTGWGLLESSFGLYNIKDFGAVGDYTTDDTAAIIACYAAAPPGSTVIIPDGRFRFTATLHFNKEVSAIALGPGSVLAPDIDAASDGVSFNTHAVGAADTWINRIRVRLYVLNDVANCCKNAIVITNVLRSEWDLHVRAQAAEWGILWGGGLFNVARITGSINFPYTVPSGVPAIGWCKMEKGWSAYAMPHNANHWHLCIEGGAAGFVVMPQGSASGNNEMTGTVEGCGQRGLDVRGCVGPHIHDLHLEQNIVGDRVLDCTNIEIHSILSTTNVGIGGPFVIDGCTGGTVHDVTCDNIEVTATCDRVQLGSISGELVNASATTIFTGMHSDIANSAKSGRGLVGGTNLARNSDFELWPNGNAAKPIDWEFFGFDIGWEKTGVGLADTRRHLTNYAAKMTMVANNRWPAIEVDFAKVSGRWITVWGYVYVPAGQPDLTINFDFDIGTESIGGEGITTKDAWVFFCQQLYMKPAYSTGRLQFKLGGAGTGHFYVANYGYWPGHAAPSHYSPPRPQLAASGTGTLTNNGDATGVLGTQTVRWHRSGNLVSVRITFEVTTNFTQHILGITGIPTPLHSMSGLVMHDGSVTAGSIFALIDVASPALLQFWAQVRTSGTARPLTVGDGPFDVLLVYEVAG